MGWLLSIVVGHQASIQRSSCNHTMLRARTLQSNQRWLMLPMCSLRQRDEHQHDCGSHHWNLVLAAHASLNTRCTSMQRRITRDSFALTELVSRPPVSAASGGLQVTRFSACSGSTQTDVFSSQFKLKPMLCVACPDCCLTTNKSLEIINLMRLHSTLPHASSL